MHREHNMRIGITEQPTLHTVAKVEKAPGGEVVITYINQNKQATFAFSMQTIKDSLGASEFTDCTSIYFQISPDAANGVVVRSKMADSTVSKVGGGNYVKRLGTPVMAQLYIPFKDATLDECALRVNVNTTEFPDPIIDPSFGQPETVALTEEALTLFFVENMPGITEVETVSMPEGFSTKVQVTMNGQPVNREGVRLFIKGAAGYFPVRERYTDAQGQTTFAAMPLGLKPEDQFVGEIGFKFVTNVLSVAYQ